MIVITYYEGDDTGVHPMRTPFTRLVYAEWTRNGVEESAYATREDDPYHGSDDAGEHEIPDDVRETLALLIAPSLAKQGAKP